jgi:hypothetical protein
LINKNIEFKVSYNTGENAGEAEHRFYTLNTGLELVDEPAFIKGIYKDLSSSLFMFHMSSMVKFDVIIFTIACTSGRGVS